MIFATLTAALVALSLNHPTQVDASAAIVIDLAEDPATTEYFLISTPVEDTPIAAVALRVIERAGDGSRGGFSTEFLYEREIVFAEGGLRIRHTETGRGLARRLVWREFLPRASRTWMVDWTAGERDGEARSMAYGWNRPVHEAVMSHMALSRPIFGPLEVLQRMRAGTLACGDAGGVIGVIDPSSAAVVDIERTVTPFASEVLVDLRRRDGTLLIGADFDARAETFTSIRLSDRAASVRRIERAEFDRLNRRWTIQSRRPYDAMLALIPARR